MVDSNPSLGVHSMDLAGIIRDLDMKDLSLEEENLWQDVIDREPRKRIHLISHIASDLGVGHILRQRGHVKRLKS